MFKSRNASLVGKVLQGLPSCASTNDWCKEHPAESGMVVYTFAQTQGRGQRGNTWLDVEGKNLAFSLVLKDLQLSAEKSFVLNKAVALAVHDVLSAESQAQLLLKWPNDLLWRGRKLAGILIENQIQGAYVHQSIIGIGINADVGDWPDSLPAAVSLRQITKRPQSPGALVQPLVEALQYRLSQLHDGEEAQLNAEYHRQLYQRGVARLFEVNGQRRYGYIKGVNDQGQLSVEWANGESNTYSHGAISWAD